MSIDDYVKNYKIFQEKEKAGNVRKNAEKLKGRKSVFIAHHGLVYSMLVSKRGNLVSEDRGVVLEKETPWPDLHDTAEAAKIKAQKMISRCNHNWHMVSHEEVECLRCGDIKYVAD